MDLLCPCHSGKPYTECCQPYHQGKAAPTPEALMRSRYSAYAMGLAQYILDTQQAKGTVADILQFTSLTQFKGLKIISSKENGSTGEVIFTAYLTQHSQDQTFTEISSFQKRQGRWIYIAGKVFAGEKLP